MTRFSIHWLVLIVALLAALALLGIGAAAPASTTQNFSFNVGSAKGDTDKFNFQVNRPGCILAQIRAWTKSGTRGAAASELRLILHGSNRSSAYAQQEGSASGILSLWTSHAVTSRDVSRVKTWTISVGNFTGNGTATGVINLEYPPTRLPCELQATPSSSGRVSLNWRYTGEPFSGFFLVERSTNGKLWRNVCSTDDSAETACVDTGSRRDTTYYYRVCAVTSGQKCGSPNRTPAIRVKTP